MPARSRPIVWCVPPDGVRITCVVQCADPETMNPLYLAAHPAPRNDEAPGLSTVPSRSSDGDSLSMPKSPGQRKGNRSDPGWQQAIFGIGPEIYGNFRMHASALRVCVFRMHSSAWPRQGACMLAEPEGKPRLRLMCVCLCVLVCERVCCHRKRQAEVAAHLPSVALRYRMDRHNGSLPRVHRHPDAANDLFPLVI